MDILLIHNKDINYYPPVKSLISILAELGHRVTLITYDGYGYKEEVRDQENIQMIGLESFKYKGKIKSFFNVFFFRRNIRRKISELLPSYDVIWTTTDTTISMVGKVLLHCDNHIMQLMELVEDAPLYSYDIIYKLHLNKRLRVSLDKYARHARCVVVPEYNRAHITATMWGLNKVPYILPNKPYKIEINDPPQDIIDTVENIKSQGKKIILYQGIFLKERRLDEFAEAVRMLGDDYVLCIVGRDRQERKELCEKYPEIIYVPFIKPPYHLLLTQIAHIGILTYFPTSDNLMGRLNVIYCAPNKIYEYAYCGLPMIGNDIPGLSGPFDKYHIGKCFDNLDKTDIAETIKEIEEDYEMMKASCRMFFDEIDLKVQVSNILNDITNK